MNAKGIRSLPVLVAAAVLLLQGCGLPAIVACDVSLSPSVWNAMSTSEIDEKLACLGERSSRKDLAVICDEFDPLPPKLGAVCVGRGIVTAAELDARAEGAGAKRKAAEADRKEKAAASLDAARDRIVACADLPEDKRDLAYTSAGEEFCWRER